jgi:hypothetical protein
MADFVDTLKGYGDVLNVGKLWLQNASAPPGPGKAAAPLGKDASGNPVRYDPSGGPPTPVNPDGSARIVSPPIEKRPLP